MRNLALARRYAKALIDIGVRDGSFVLYNDELQRIRTLLRAHAGLSRIVGAPLLSRDRLKEIVALLARELGLSKTVLHFLSLLVDKARIRHVEEIAEVSQQLVDGITNVARARVTAAGPLLAEEVDQIRKSLEHYTGKNVILLQKEDPSLIGGLIVEMGDVILDHSIRTQLTHMRTRLTRT